MAVNHERLTNSSSESPGALDISIAARPTFATGGSGSKGEFDNRSKNRPLVICYSLRESAGQTALGSTPAWSTALRFRVRWV